MHEIFHSQSRSNSLTFTGGQLKVKESAVSSGYGVRVLEQGRLGFAYCQHEKDIKQALAGAVSKFSVKSSFSFPEKRPFKTPRIFDGKLDKISYAELKSILDRAREATESLGGRARVMLSCGSSAVDIRNTSDFQGSYEKTDFSLYAESMHDDGFGFAYLSSNGLPSDVSGIGLRAANMAKDMRGAIKPAAGSYTVVLVPEALDSFLDVLLPSFSGDWKRRKITKLVQGRKMLSELLTMWEDGLAPASNARPFDDEGTPSERRCILEKGVMKSFFFDRETAALAGEKADGSCSRRDYSTPPAIGQSNLEIAPGEWKTLDDLGRFIEVHSVHGSHTANASSGDFGLEASTAFLVDNGRRRPLRGFMLVGNIFEMFSRIEGLEKEQRTVGPLIAPKIAFRDVRVVS